MFAINHAATALIIKKSFHDVSIVWILISVQFMELIWVLLNYLGIEKTKTEATVRYVGDIELQYMPYSHSIISMAGVAVLSCIILSNVFDMPRVGLAFGIGVASHLILDLITHQRDIPIAPFIGKPKFGLGLYANLPIPAFVLEIGYGIFCWWIYKGGLALLAIIVLFNLANLSMFSRTIPGLEKITANRPMLITTVVLVQIVVTLLLVGLFS
jgi:hypothetical protein